MKYLIGNWKMNPLSVKEAVELAKAEARAGEYASEKLFVGLAVPFPFISKVREKVGEVAIGAQDVFWESEGAYTGEVSPVQLQDVGADFVIVGHSERRIYLDESDEQISKKIKAGLEAGFRVVLCVGEPAEVREKGVNSAKKYIKKQLMNCLSLVISQESLVRENLVVAYEPIWAISTFEGSKPATPEDAEEMISFIKELLVTRYSLRVAVIYGGSSDSDNVEDFLKQPSIDGALPGGASLRPDDFVEMVKQASKSASIE